jgi:hypothetical protein
MATTAIDFETTPRRRARRAALAVGLWVFGVATTVMLIGVWGRTVAGDESTLSASARAAVGSEEVGARVGEWLREGVAGAAARAPAELEAVVAAVERHPEAVAAVDVLVDQAVAAALAPPGTTVVVDVAGALRPLAPVVAAELVVAGVPVEAAAVEEAFGDLPAVELETGDAVGFVGSALRVRSALTRVVVVAGAMMLVAGGAVVALAEERARILRTLLVRVALSAATFAVILRVGAWAVDPRGGRSPVASGGSELLRSNGWILALIAAGAGLAATAGWVTARRRPA